VQRKLRGGAFPTAGRPKNGSQIPFHTCKPEEQRDDATSSYKEKKKSDSVPEDAKRSRPPNCKERENLLFVGSRNQKQKNDGKKKEKKKKGRT